MTKQQLTECSSLLHIYVKTLAKGKDKYNDALGDPQVDEDGFFCLFPDVPTALKIRDLCTNVLELDN